ncbi:serine/threonine protein kinase [Tautonia marina]|uniref:serine/threonine protein kinase n=1 Tax=Tautonia marina TaxID=2653855 RepID=UPI001375C86F|nr:serine/threonine-protein kinase [Tautonia marina]
MIGQRLGSFQLESKIGAGAMGEVFKATRHLKDGRTRTAAVKIISAEYLARDNALKRFQRESELLAQLRHPNIVRYYAHGKAQGIYYYAMEFVEGEPLDSVIERRGFLPWDEVVELGIQLCQALQFAHEHQVVHRDLKPSNLMLTKDGQIKLTDFGIAKDLDATTDLTKTGRTLGTVAYMAPEQIHGKIPISHWTDLYALGCLLYQMLTGQTPFAGSSPVILMQAHLNTPPPRPSEKNPDIPRALDDLVVRLMSKTPSDRAWDAAQVAYQLEELRERHRRGDRVEMVFDRARAKVADEGGTVLLSRNGDSSAPAGTESRPRKPSKTRSKAKTKTKARAAADDLDPDARRRRMLETAGLALALVALIGLVTYLMWPPSMETLYARAETLMQSDSRPDWKRAFSEAVEPIERRFPDHPYGEQFAEWRDRIALDEAEGRAVQLASPTPLGRPRSDRPVEALYKTVLSEIVPFERLEQHAMIAAQWQRFTQELARRNDPEERGWLLLGQQRWQEQVDALREQKQIAFNLYQQALINERNELFEPARAQLHQLITSYTTPAQGDREFLQLIANAQAVLDRMDDEQPSADASVPSPAPSEPPSDPESRPEPEPEAPDLPISPDAPDPTREGRDPDRDQGDEPSSVPGVRP